VSDGSLVTAAMSFTWGVRGSGEAAGSQIGCVGDTSWSSSTVPPSGPGTVTSASATPAGAAGVAPDHADGCWNARARAALGRYGTRRESRAVDDAVAAGAEVAGLADRVPAVPQPADVISNPKPITTQPRRRGLVFMSSSFRRTPTAT